MTIENIFYLIGGILAGNVIAIGIAYWYDLCTRWRKKSPIIDTQDDRSSDYL